MKPTDPLCHILYIVLGIVMFLIGNSKIKIDPDARPLFSFNFKASLSVGGILLAISGLVQLINRIL